MKIFTGQVISTNIPKTAKVMVTRVVAHPVYKKRVKKTKKFLVHDEIGAEVGQNVRFVACAPLSKMKKWKIIEIVGVKTSGKKETVDIRKKAKEKGVTKTSARKKAGGKEK